MLSDDVALIQRAVEFHDGDHVCEARSKWLISALRGRLRAIQTEGRATQASRTADDRRLEAYRALQFAMQNGVVADIEVALERGRSLLSEHLLHLGRTALRYQVALDALQAVMLLPGAPEDAALMQEALSLHGPVLARHGLVDDVRNRLRSIKVSVSRGLQAVMRSGSAAEIEEFLERGSSLLSDEELQEGRKAVVTSQIAAVAERVLAAPNREKVCILRRLIEQGSAQLADGQLCTAREVLAAVEPDVRDVCAICFDEEKSTFQLSCCGRSTGSSWICHDCVAPLTSCPFCRAPCN